MPRRVVSSFCLAASLGVVVVVIVIFEVVVGLFPLVMEEEVEQDW